ncbi:MAG: biotin transporter BioY [Bacillota bacterium]|nr:biotin transporter BioY [Bacillota bacterium]MDW7683281.1 biotin transporter BioY [Bacillota bacterium]
MKQKYSVRDLTLIALFAALTSIMAYITIPMPAGLPPITGQTFAVMLAGMLLGAKKGAMSQIIYILLGIAGLPVFAGAMAGAGVLAGYSGGFIWGFVPGAYIIGKLTEKQARTPLSILILAAFTGGVIAVYIPGVWQMAKVLGWPADKAVIAMLPYIPGDLVKVAASSLLAQKVLHSITASQRFTLKTDSK